MWVNHLMGSSSSAVWSNVLMAIISQNGKGDRPLLQSLLNSFKKTSQAVNFEDCYSPKRGHMLMSWPRILDVAHWRRRSYRKIWTFWTYVIDVKTSVWASLETLLGLELGLDRWEYRFENETPLRQLLYKNFEQALNSELLSDSG